MSPAIRDTASTAVAVSVLVGLVVRYLLLPYLQDHLVTPVKEVQKQVTENHHETPEQPTIPDRIEDLHDAVRGLAQVMNTHMEWSDREHRVMSRKLKALRKQARRHHPNGDSQ